MEEKSRVKCIMNSRELQLTIIILIISYILNRLYPQINVYRLTPLTYYRQLFLTIEPGTTVSILGACIAGPWAGLMLSFSAWNPIYVTEVNIIVKAVQFMTIGYLHRNFKSSLNLLSIPIGIIASSPIHPSLVHYILFRQKLVYTLWGTNVIFQTIVNFCIYLLVRILAPRLFEWVNPEGEYKLSLPFLQKI
jgi:hypothetical protein